MTVLAVRDRWSVVTLGEHGEGAPAPWETLFAWPRFGDAHVALSGPDARTVWAARLDAAVSATREPVLLVANGAGCLAAAWWARLSPASYVSTVAGAMFFAPSDDAAAHDAFASPHIRLPFPSLVIASDGDAASLAPIAEDWGSRVMRRARPRAATAATAQTWRYAQRLVGAMTAQVVERDVANLRRLRPVDFAGR